MFCFGEQLIGRKRLGFFSWSFRPVLFSFSQLFMLRLGVQTFCCSFYFIGVRTKKNFHFKMLGPLVSGCSVRQRFRVQIPNWGEKYLIPIDTRAAQMKIIISSCVTYKFFSPEIMLFLRVGKANPLRVRRR